MRNRFDTEEPQKPTLTFSELALLYFPESESGYAVRQLRRQINANIFLKSELRKEGCKRGQRIYMPNQVKTIFRILGTPY